MPLPIVRPAFMLAVLFLVAAPTARAEQLRWKLKQGDELQVNTTETVKSTTRYTGQDINSTTTFVIESRWKVDAVEEGSFQLTQTIERAKVEILSPMTDPIVYDSSSDQRPTGAARQLQTVLKPLLGTSIKLTMNDRGEVSSVQLPELSPADAKAGSVALTAATKEILNTALSKPLVVLPEKDVAAGDEWPGQTKTNLPAGEVTTAKTYRLVSFADEADGKQAAIEADGKVDYSAQSKLKVVDSSFRQTATFDVAAGLLTGSEQTVRVKTEKPYRETTITVDVESTVKTTIQRAK
jgi:hypothetical protein